MGRPKKIPVVPLSDDGEEEESASIIPAGPPLTSKDLKCVEKEVRDQKTRVNKLKREEQGTVENPGRYNPNLRAEMKLLAELYKLRWMIAKVPDPASAIGAAGGTSAASAEVNREFATDMLEAERIFRKLVEENGNPPK